MIIDSLSNASLYHSLHPLFEQAFSFIATAHTLPEGRYQINGNDLLYATITTADGREPQNAPLEAHQQYIDIQMPLEQNETFGYSPLSENLTPTAPYNQQNDIVFFQNKPQTFITATKNQFLIFFPQDAHAPLIAPQKIKKIIVKVRAK